MFEEVGTTMAATAPDGVVFFCWVTLAVGEASTCGGRTTIVRDIVGDIIVVVVVVHRLVSSQQESVPLVAWRGDDVSVCFELLLDTAGLLRSKQVAEIQKSSNAASSWLAITVVRKMVGEKKISKIFWLDWALQ